MHKKNLDIPFYYEEPPSDIEKITKKNKKNSKVVSAYKHHKQNIQLRYTEDIKDNTSFQLFIRFIYFGFNRWFSNKCWTSLSVHLHANSS